MINSFDFKRQCKKLLATFCISLLFIWFYTQGPLNKVAHLERLVFNDSPFLSPTFIQDEPLQQLKQFGLITADKLSLTGLREHGLLGKKRELKTYGLIADAQHLPSMAADVADAMREHAQLFNPLVTSTLKHALDMFYIEQRDQKNQFTRLYLESTGLTEHIKGYAGPIKMGLSLSAAGKIHAVNYIGSEETSSYLRQIMDAGFYQQFVGIAIDGKAYQIDAVSGATITTQAVAKTLTALLNKAAESPLSLYLAEDAQGINIHAELTNEWLIQMGLIGLCFIYFWQPWFMRTRSRNNIVLLASAVYIGFYLNNSFTYISLLHPFVGVAVSMLVAGYCAVVLLGAIWDNNTYCKFVCPYGNVQRLLTRIFPRWRRSFFIPARWVQRIRMALTLVILVGVILGNSQWASYELFPDLFSLDIRSFWFVIALLILALTSIYPMLWCRLLCPTGEVLDWLSKLVAPLKTTHKIQKVTAASGCQQCNGVNK